MGLGSRITVLMYLIESRLREHADSISFQAQLIRYLPFPLKWECCRMVKQDIKREMSMPYVLQRSDVPFPHKLWKACAVTWNDVTIIWGGMKGGPGGPLGNTMVYCFISGEWIMKETSGDVPQRCSSSVFPNRCDGSDVCIESSLGQWRAHPQVIKDQMFVLASPCGNDAALYSLDLRSWVWTRLSPSGTPPNRNIWWASSFSHSGKLYFFGGNISIELPGRAIQ